MEQLIPLWMKMKMKDENETDGGAQAPRIGSDA